MNASLLLVGLAKAVFGIIVGAVGIVFASRGVQRLIGARQKGEAPAKDNVALGILRGAMLLALGILLQPAVTATFSAMDLFYRGRALDFTSLRRFVTYAGLHIGLSAVVGACVLALGLWLFTKLTPKVDEVAEIRGGDPAPAIVLAAVMIVLAFMTAPGLQTALDGLLPLPVLGRDEVVAPT